MKWILLISAAVVMIGASKCSNGPNVSIYISTPKSNGMNWANASTGQQGFVPYSSTDKYVCMTPTDAQTLFSYCRSAENPPSN